MAGGWHNATSWQDLGIPDGPVVAGSRHRRAVGHRVLGRVTEDEEGRKRTLVNNQHEPPSNADTAWLFQDADRTTGRHGGTAPQQAAEHIAELKPRGFSNRSGSAGLLPIFAAVSSRST